MKVQLKSQKNFRLQINFVNNLYNHWCEAVSLILVCADDIMNTHKEITLEVVYVRKNSSTIVL